MSTRGGGNRGNRVAESSRRVDSMQTRQGTITAARAPKSPRPMTATQRKTLATKQLIDSFGPNQNAAVTAALETVNERLSWDTALRQRISEKYGELTAVSATSSSRSRTSSGPAPKPLSAGGNGPTRSRSFEHLDPYRVLADFGRDNLREMLSRDTQGRLRTAVTIVQERHPGTKPASRSRNADMVDYIVEHVAGPGY